MIRRLLALFFLLLFAASSARAVPADWTLGNKTLLYIRIDFPDLSGDPVSTPELQSTLTKVEAYFRENSFGLYTLKSTFTPTLRMPNPASFYEGNKDQQHIIRDAREAAKKIGFDTAHYNLDIVSFKTHNGINAELAGVRGKGARILNNFRPGITIHAIGHNLGLPHAGFWISSDGSILGPGKTREYGDPLDPMGADGNADFFRDHFNIRSKARLGWLGPTGLTEVTTPGRYRLYPLDFASPVPGSRGLHISRDDQTDYWIEFRQLITDNPSVMNGVRILRGYKNRNAVDLLDMTPDSPGGPADAPLLVGQTFSDPQANLYITPVSLNNTTPPSIDVVVNHDSTANQPLVVQMSSTATSAKAGAPITFTAKTINPGHSDLLYSWDYGDGTFDFGHDTAHHIWKDPDRDYIVRCTVTDLHAQSSSQIQLITIGQPSTGKIIGTITENGKPLDKVRITAAPSGIALAELLHSKTPIEQASLLTDSTGHFALIGLRNQTYTLRSTKPGYYILPTDISCPSTVPLELKAKKITSSTNSSTLHIHAKIDGNDELIITLNTAIWKHASRSWPSNITLNNIPMDPHKPLPNTGETAFLPKNSLLSSATILQQSGRGSIDMRLQGQSLFIQFDDPQNGASEYDLDIAFNP
ncbi:MAG TPA: PKD domain-containing protein [Tepidisphaeraceae bacterium]|nr:PKD domain-containing protein [Tepidisphaeraceae bacterium]